MTETDPHQDKMLYEMRFGRDLSWRQVTTMAGALSFAIAVFVLVHPLLRLAGSISWLGYLAAGVTLALVGLSLGELAGQRGRHPSGLYGLMRGATYSAIPFLVGWLLVLGCVALAGLAAQAFALYVLPFLSDFMPSTPLSERLISTAAIVIATFGNMLGTRRSRRIQAVAAIVAAALLVLAIFWALPGFRFSRFAQGVTLTPNQFVGFIGLLAPGLVGLELALQARNEVRAPLTTFAPALFASMMATFTLIALIAAAATGLIGSAGLSSASLPLAAFVDASMGPVAGGLMQVLAALALVATISTILLLTSRQVRALARDGYLPAQVHDRLSSAGPVRRWPAVVGLLVLGVTLCPTDWLLAVAGGCFLACTGAVCLRNVLTREREMEHTLPFRPLIPALALTLEIFLLATIRPIGLLLIAGWVVVGVLLFLAYGRKGFVSVQQRAQVFSVRKERSDQRPDFSILVPVIGGGVSLLQMQVAASLARSQDGEVVPLRVIALSEQMTQAEGERLAREESQLLSWSVPTDETGHVTYYPIARLGRNIAQAILDTAREEESDLILLGWRGQTAEGEAQLGQVVDEVVRNAPCDVALVKGREVKDLKRILVPTAGGPHAPLAARLGLQLAADCDGRVTMLYVVPRGSGQAGHPQAYERIEATIADLPHVELAEPHIIEADGDIVESILGESARGYDLTLLGASNMGIVDRLVFGNVPERFAREANTPVIMTKHFGGPARYWSYQVWRAVDRLFPDLSSEEQVTLYRRLRTDARPDINYFIMIVLASIVATLGLLQNSAAVIIGAMLVAPLMSPILGVSMAIVRADFRLLSLAIEAALKGAVGAVIIAIVLTLIVPADLAGSEILARTHPTILDMIVALASGAAGAYALGRKEVAAALPGVAIAAALMPPLAVVGIGIAGGNGPVAGGAMLLFITNLIAISVAGAVVFELLGIRPRPGHDHHLRHGFAISFLLLTLISIPLAAILANSMETSHQKDIVLEAVQEHLNTWKVDADVVDVTYAREGDGSAVSLTIRCSTPIDETRITQLGQNIQRRLNIPVSMHVTVVPVSQFDLQFQSP